MSVLSEILTYFACVSNSSYICLPVKRMSMTYDSDRYGTSLNKKYARNGEWFLSLIKYFTNFWYLYNFYLSHITDKIFRPLLFHRPRLHFKSSADISFIRFFWRRSNNQNLLIGARIARLKFKLNIKRCNIALSINRKWFLLGALIGRRTV